MKRNVKGSSVQPDGTQPVLAEPNPADRRRENGGWKTHKVDCICRPCTAHRRKTETLTLSIRPRDAGDEPTFAEDGSEVLEGDAPELNKPTRADFRNNSARARVATWIHAKATNPYLTNADIARKMGIAPGTLTSILYKATRAGWLTFEDPLQKIEYNIIPQVVENLDYFLKQRDKTVTIETAKGTIFKDYQEKHGLNEQPQTVLAIKIEKPEGTGKGEVKIVTGKVVGRPRGMED